MALTLFVIVVVGGFLVLLALRTYLHSDKFRVLVSDEVSEVFQADGDFAGFQWTGMAAYTDDFKAQGRSGALFSRARADGIRARVNFGAVWDRVWEITDVDVDRFDVLLAPPFGEKSPKVDDQVAGRGDDSSGGGGWLSAFLPKEDRSGVPVKCHSAGARQSISTASGFSASSPKHSGGVSSRNIPSPFGADLADFSQHRPGPLQRRSGDKYSKGHNYG